MTVETYCLGSMQTNAYVVSFGRPECWVFDCPGDPGPLIGALAGWGARPQGVYLTHAHVDHMAGLDEFRAAFPGTPVFQHALEAAWLADPSANLSAWLGEPVTAAAAEHFAAEGQILPFGSTSARVLHLPGHSPGSVGYWFETEGELFSGDVLFRSGVGRWDFPGSDQADLRRSVARVCALPDATRVRPGHGGSTTAAKEKASNPYVRSDAWD